MSPAAKAPEHVALGGGSPDHVKRSAERQARREAAHVPPGTPVCPDSLSTKEREVWDETVEVLAERNSLTLGDGHALELFCRTKVRWEEESVALLTEGTVIRVTKVIRNQPCDCDIVNPRGLSAHDYPRPKGN